MHDGQPEGRAHRARTLRKGRTMWCRCGSAAASTSTTRWEPSDARGRPAGHGLAPPPSGYARHLRRMRRLHGAACRRACGGVEGPADRGAVPVGGGWNRTNTVPTPSRPACALRRPRGRSPLPLPAAHAPARRRQGSGAAAEGPLHRAIGSVSAIDVLAAAKINHATVFSLGSTWCINRQDPAMRDMRVTPGAALVAAHFSWVAGTRKLGYGSLVPVNIFPAGAKLERPFNYVIVP